MGRYLAPEVGATTAQAATRPLSSPKSSSHALLTPSLYALRSIQNRLRRHLLYDLSVGPGLLAPARTGADYYLPGRH